MISAKVPTASSALCETRKCKKHNERKRRRKMEHATGKVLYFVVLADEIAKKDPHTRERPLLVETEQA